MKHIETKKNMISESHFAVFSEGLLLEAVWDKLKDKINTLEKHSTTHDAFDLMHKQDGTKRVEK